MLRSSRAERSPRDGAETATCHPSRPGPATQLTTCRPAGTPRRASCAREEVWSMPTKQPTMKPRTEPRTEPRITAPVSTGIGLAFEWFLVLPVPVVLLVLWVAVVVFFGACALLTYEGISAVVGWSRERSEQTPALAFFMPYSPKCVENRSSP